MMVSTDPNYQPSCCLRTVGDANAYIQRAMAERQLPLEDAFTELSTNLFSSETRSDGQFAPLFPFTPAQDALMAVSPGQGHGQLPLLKGYAMVQDIEDSVMYYEAPANRFFTSDDPNGDNNTDTEGTQQIVSDVQQVYLIPVPGLPYGDSHQGTVEGEQQSLAGGSRKLERVRQREEEEQEGEVAIADEDDEYELEVVVGEEEEEAPTTTKPVGARGVSKCDREGEKDDRHKGNRQRRDITSRETEITCVPIPVGASTYAGMTQQLNLPHDPVSESLLCACVATVFTPSSSSNPAENGGKTTGTSSGAGNKKDGSVWFPTLNDVVEVIGFFQPGPAPSNTSTQQPLSVEGNCGEMAMMMKGAPSAAALGWGSVEDDIQEFAQWRCNGLPPSIVKTFVCVAARPCRGTPLVSISRALSLGTSSTSRTAESLKTARASCLSYLTTLLQGDALLAHYLLLQLVSSVRHRGDDGFPVGDLPIHVFLPNSAAAGDLPLSQLRLSSASLPRNSSVGAAGDVCVGGLPSASCSNNTVGGGGGAGPQQKSNSEDGSALHWVRAVVEGLRRISPHGALSISRPQDSHRRLVPKKDIDRNYLISGLLQLPTGSHLTIDLSRVEYSDQRWIDVDQHPAASAAGSVSTSKPHLPVLVNDLSSPTTTNEVATGTTGDRHPSSSSHKESTSLVATLESLCHRQCLKYDYCFQHVEVQTDVQVLLVSELSQTELAQVGTTGRTGMERHPHVLLKRSDGLMNLPLSLPWIPGGNVDDPAALATTTVSSIDSNTGTPGSQQLTALSGIKDYLALVQQKAFDVHQEHHHQGTPAAGAIAEVMDAIAEDMVKEKSSSPERFNNCPLIHNNTMSMRLALATAMASSYGETQLNDMSHWQEAKALEHQRIDRCTQLIDDPRWLAGLTN